MKLLRVKEVLKEVPVSKSTLYQWVKDGQFPAPIRLGGGRCSCWPADEIEEFLNNLKKESINKLIKK